MKKICSISVARIYLLQGKVSVFMELLNNILMLSEIGEDGKENLIQAVRSYGIKPTPQGVENFARSIEGDHVGIIAYDDNGEYHFKLVSGSKHEIQMME
jgi:hypothetical protein